jgi:hypothetical protein
VQPGPKTILYLAREILGYRGEITLTWLALQLYVSAEEVQHWLIEAGVGEPPAGAFSKGSAAFQGDSIFWLQRGKAGDPWKLHLRTKASEPDPEDEAKYFDRDLSKLPDTTMSEQFKTIQEPTATIEASLNRLGVEGWKALNCWPSGNGQTTCVLTRTLEYWDPTTKSFQPCRPLHLMSLEYALALCLESKPGKTGSQSIRLSKLGIPFGADETAVLNRLKEAGLKESKRMKNAVSDFLSGYLIWCSLSPDRDGHFWMGAKLMKKTDAAARDTSVDELETESELVEDDPADEPLVKTAPRKSPAAIRSAESPISASKVKKARPAKPASSQSPSIESIIEFCLTRPPKQPGWPHSANLQTIGKQLGCDWKQIAEVVRSHGVPDTPSDPKKPYVLVAGHLIGLKRSGQSQFLNVKAPR